MKVWEVTNTGQSYIRVYVIAETKEEAKELAIPKFKEELKAYNYEDRFWDRLEAQIFLHDENRVSSMKIG